MSLASLMLMTDSADAQQSTAPLPTIEVNPPPRQRTRSRPRRQAQPAPAPAVPAEEPAVQETATGPGGNPTGYRAANPGISRIPTSLLDTPQTINVVTQKVIRDQNIQTMEEALRNVPGITFSAGEGGQQGDSPIIRGFSARTDIFRDGLRDPGWYTRDLFSIDRVEVYKGPSAFAFGRGATGGAINNVSKLPTGEQFLDTTVSFVSPSGFRTDVDASGKQGNWAGRIAGMYQDIDTQSRDNIWTKRWGVAPSVSVDISDQTKLTLAHIYQGEESVPDYGHPWRPAPQYSSATGALTNPGYNGNGTAVLPVQVPRNNWYGFTGGPFPDLVTTDTNISTIKVDHQFNPGLKLTNATRYVAVNREARPTAPRSLGLAGQLGSTATTPPPGYPESLMTIGRQHFQTNTDNSLLLNQTDINANFVTGFLLHTLAAGLEVSQEKRSQERANLCNPTGAGACRTSLWTPNSNGPVYGTYTGYGPITDTTQNLLAVYASDQIKVNRYWEILGAARVDSFDSEVTNPTAATLNRSDTLFSYRVGTVFHPTEKSSIYFAYGNSYNPSAEFGTLSSSPTSTNSVLLDPEKNISYEAGVKVDVLQDQLSLTGAVFRIEKTNMRIPNDPVTNTFLQLDGEAKVDGVELGAAGRITKEWGITTGYSHLDSEITKTTNMAELGRQLPNAPQDSFTLWTTYDVTSKWTVGGGAIYQSDAFANTTNTQYVPSFWRFDAMASYKLAANTLIQLNIYNLTDEFYYAQYYGGHAVPVAGRYASVSLRVRW